MTDSVRLDDMRLFARIAEAETLTAAARVLGMPKQTVSRRLADLENALGVPLVARTTRSLRLTDVGRAYATRCAEVARLAREANLSVSSEHDEPSGTLRITADPTFGHALLPDLVAAYANRHREVRVEVQLTNRIVDLVEEGFDAAFRVGHLDDSSLVSRRLGAARLVLCASPAYLQERGIPRGPADLERHDCIELSPQGGPTRWPLAGPGGIEAVTVTGRIRVTGIPMAQRAALAGLGIAALPRFACADDLRDGRLVPVLETWSAEVGGVFVVYPAHRILTARVRALVDLAAEHFAPKSSPLGPPQRQP